MDKLSFLEARAQQALGYQAFPVNLIEIRDSVKILLSEVQRYGFFNEYTSHGFGHVLGMLDTAEWVIPKASQELLTSSECLLLVLAIYFHDIGLLISLSEYEERVSNPDYLRFLDELHVGDDGLEYFSKLDKLSQESKDKVLYSEFVRKTHGVRVKTWIEGGMLNDNEASASIRASIQSVVGKIDSVAKKDLAMLCESHTLDDIYDITKYKISRPYGQSTEEMVDLQYLAVVLRVVDLLQITNRRAPAALYRVVNPKDPISQLEWQKQGAVRAVKPALGVDSDGRVSQTAISNKIEVHARFEESDGFFGLTSYLAYARTQLELCQEALRKSENLRIRNLLFPWKIIDDEEVEAEGFLTESFGFELDQQKILDLLTGHTLYNDTDVVIRELTQNSLDAIRLQSEIDSEPSEENGVINIAWNSKLKLLEISDNGTGMSQNVIEKHLLKVGSSRYQDSKFKEQYPNFSSISRFGIGVLSAFMVADSVEITTCSIDDEKARQISLRSVHGKYLIKLLDKISDQKEIGVYPHGTRIRLVLRNTASIGNVLDVAKMWLLFPRCAVNVKIDDQEPVRIGFKDPKEALESYISQSGWPGRKAGAEYEVRQVYREGVTLAYAVSRDDLFNDWSFVQLDNRGSIYYQEEDSHPLVVTCVEGVGVEFTTPGFEGDAILAVANVVGRNAPKTNVARSALEDTLEYREMLKKLYHLYAGHVADEISRLTESDDYSLSRAVQQAPFITAPLINNINYIRRPALFEEALADIPLFLIEETGKRKNISMKSLGQKDYFWTVDSPLIFSVEYLIREVSSDISASMIFDRIQDGNVKLPSGATVCNISASSYHEGLLKKGFEPRIVEADEKTRKIMLKWVPISGEPWWISGIDLVKEVSNSNRRLGHIIKESNEHRRGGRLNQLGSIPVGPVEIFGLESVTEFVASRSLYYNPADSISVYLKKTWLDSSGYERALSLSAYLICLQLLRNYGYRKDRISVDGLSRLMRSNNTETLLEHMDLSGFIEAIRTSKGRAFDPFAWQRRGSGEE